MKDEKKLRFERSILAFINSNDLLPKGRKSLKFKWTLENNIIRLNNSKMVFDLAHALFLGSLDCSTSSNWWEGWQVTMSTSPQALKKGTIWTTRG